LGNTIGGVKETAGVRKMKKQNHSIPLKHELRKISKKSMVLHRKKVKVRLEMFLNFLLWIVMNQF
jgi:hypothetical protein